MSNRRAKKLSLVCLILALLISIAVPPGSAEPVYAASPGTASGKVDATIGAVLRSRATTDSDRVKVLLNNASLDISEEVFTTTSRADAENRWYKVTSGKKSGYIRADLVKNINYYPVTGTTTAEVNYRAGAGVNMRLKGTLKKGTSVQVLMKATGKGSVSNWYKIKSGSKTGFVSAKWIRLSSTSSSNKASSSSGSSKTSSTKLSFSLKNMRYPEEIVEGKAFSIMGQITCTHTISNVEVRITNSLGTKTHLSTKKSVKAKSFDLLDADRDIKFGSLKAGTYKYKVILTVDGKKYTKVNRKFKIVKPKSSTKTSSSTKISSTTSSTKTESTATSSKTTLAAAAPAVSLSSGSQTTSGKPTFTKKDMRYPKSIVEGMAFSIMGIISCNQEITSGRVDIINYSGTVVQSAEVSVGDTDFDILTADNSIRFGVLTPGTYIYKVVVTVNGREYTKVKKEFKITGAKKAKRITNKAFSLAWPVGTAKKTYSYKSKSGKATHAYAVALDQVYKNRSHWGDAPQDGASCDVFVGTVLRSCGVDGSAPRGLSDQFTYFKKSGKYLKVRYTGDHSVLKSGDIIIYKKKGGGAHTCIYLKKNGKEYIAEANYNSTYAMLIDNSSMIKHRLTKSNKAKMYVYRIIEN